MAKVIMLGTGNGEALNLFNTCFVIQNDNGIFLIDTGGSIEIIKKLQDVNINFLDIEHIFISHSHTDHIFGLIWILKKIGIALKKREYVKNINIYCNDIVYEAIMNISKYTLSEKTLIKVLEKIKFHILNDGDVREINGINYTFFDINAKKVKQFGFECNLNNKRLVFLGDETLNDIMYNKVKNVDYVMHEAFCMYSDINIFNSYIGSHSTVKSVCEVMNKLGVKNLILYHTEEIHGENKKRLYTEEGRKYFSGNVIVPDDLDIIDIL